MYKTSSINEVLRKEQCPDKLVDMILPSILETDLFPGHTKIRPVSRPTGTTSDENETTEVADASTDQNRSSPESAVSSASGNRPNRHRSGHKEPSDKKKSHGSRPERGDPDARYPNSHRPDRDHARPDRNPPNYVFNLKPDELDETESTSDTDDGYHDFVKPGRPEPKGSTESKRPYEPNLHPDKGRGSSSERGPDKRSGEWSPFDKNTAVESYEQTRSEPDGDRLGHKPRPPRRGDIGIQSLDEKSEWDERKFNRAG